MSKELEAYFKIDHTLCLNSQNIKLGIDEDDHIDCQNIDEVVNCLETIKKALEERESIDNANPSEALECLEKIIDNLDDYADFEIKQEANEYTTTIKQALLKAQEDKKKLNEIEKLTHLLYSERRKIGQEYVKWCKENNTVFNDETNMITWVLAIKLKEWLK